MVTLAASPRTIQAPNASLRRVEAPRPKAAAAPRPSFWKVLLRALAAAAV